MKPISVYQLNNYLGRILETDPLLGEIAVIGEISNLKFHQSGHVFFSLKDSRSKVDCFLAAGRVAGLKEHLAEGAEVIVYGGIRVYEPRGTYSLQVSMLETAGQGDLAVAFEKMKQKLEAEGLFAMEHKKPLPAFPRSVAVVTAKTGAAVQDMLRILTGRNDYVDIYVFPVTVQGTTAAPEIAATIDWINEHYPEIDVMLVGRGGGSAEDLWAFNEEIVARSIYNSEIPVISAVGHEIDFTIADFVADVRAATPTDAANLAVPDMNLIRQQIKDSMRTATDRMAARLALAKQQLAARDVSLQKELLIARIGQERLRIEKLKETLENLDPRNVLARGYAMVTDENGKVIGSAADTAKGQNVTIAFRDGTAKATITEPSEVEP